MAYDSKSTSAGYIEIRDSGVTGWYGLFVDGKLIKQSPDYSYIKSEFNKY